MQRTFILFLPALLNFIIGWGLYFYLYSQTKNYERAAELLQYWVVFYAPFISSLFAYFFYITLKKKGEDIFEIKLNKWLDYIIGLTLGFIMGLVMYFVVKVMVPDFSYPEFSPLMKIANYLSAVVLAPFTEEFIFRRYAKFLFAQKEKQSHWLAVFISGLSFALWHANFYIIPSAFVIGVLYYLIYTKTNNLMIPIIAHGVSNLLFFMFI